MPHVNSDLLTFQEHQRSLQVLVGFVFLSPLFSMLCFLCIIVCAMHFVYQSDSVNNSEFETKVVLTQLFSIKLTYLKCIVVKYIYKMANGV